MGENKHDQPVASTKADQQQHYGSLQQGRHNREGTSADSDDRLEKQAENPYMERQNRMNRQDLDDQEREDDSYDYEKEDETYEHGRFSTRSQLNEMQEDNMVARVEGDDKDILGETENSRRNQQRRRETDSNQGNPQNR